MRTLQTIILISIFSSLSLFAGGNKSLKADKSESSIKWTGEKVSGEHWGYVDLKSGVVEFDEAGNLVDGNFKINMTSMTVEDIEDEKYNQKLKGHLMSDDFFSVEKHKESTFEITNVKKVSANMSKVTGKLTIKGISNQVTFDVKHKMEGGKFVAEASIPVDRTKYKIEYNSGNFFENLGDKLIYDDFIIDLKLVAKG